MRPKGEPTGVPCPACGTVVVYNGNYYCPETDCWRMTVYENPKRFHPLFSACYEGLMKCRDERRR